MKWVLFVIIQKCTAFFKNWLCNCVPQTSTYKINVMHTNLEAILTVLMLPVTLKRRGESWFNTVWIWCMDYMFHNICFTISVWYQCKTHPSAVETEKYSISTGCIGSEDTFGTWSSQHWFEALTVYEGTAIVQIQKHPVFWGL